MAVHELRLASARVRLLAQAAASSQMAQLCCELQEAWKRRDHSLCREIWLMLLRSRVPDIRQTATHVETDADLNIRLLAIMREIRERQFADREEPKTSCQRLPSVSKPCGTGYHVRPPLMKR